MGLVRFMAVPQEGASIPAILILTVAHMMVLASTNPTTPIRTFVHTIHPILTLTRLVGLEMDHPHLTTRPMQPQQASEDAVMGTLVSRTETGEAEAAVDRAEEKM